MNVHIWMIGKQEKKWGVDQDVGVRRSERVTLGRTASMSCPMLEYLQASRTGDNTSTRPPLSRASETL